MSIKDIKLRKGMSREEVNELISEWLLLEDEVYMGAAHKHDWKCMECGGVIKGRQWQGIRRYNSITCGCVAYNEVEQRYKHEVEKDGEYEYIRSYRRGNILPSGKNTGNDTYIQVKHKYCGNVYEIQSGQFINCGCKCGKCCQTYENSFAYHIEVELGLDINDVWDFEKNTVNPYHISRGSNNKVWIKCQNEEVNELNGLMKKDYHPSYEISCPSFLSGNRCSYCKKQYTVHKYDSAGFLNPNISNMIVYDEYKNNVDIFKINLHSAKKYYFKCNECGCVSSSPKEIRKMNRKITCEYCSDGISVPEKFMVNVLKQLKIKYIREFSRYHSEWILDKIRYDFYIPEQDIIIETHGAQHYDGNNGWGTDVKMTKKNDQYKRNIAKNNVKRYIEVDCKHSDFIFLKNSFEYSLGETFDLRHVDWEDAYKKSSKSIMVEVCNLYNEGCKYPKDIAFKLNISTSTVTAYLKRGRDIGICDYSKEEVRSFVSKRHSSTNKLKGEIILKNCDKINFDGLDSLLDILNISTNLYYQKIKNNNNVIDISRFSKARIPKYLDGAIVMLDKVG